jgi:hypothetical protein
MTPVNLPMTVYTGLMSAMNPTPPDRLVDALGRPYFAWDLDLTLEAFRQRLGHPDPEVRAYFIGKLMRQAKPDDVFSFVTARAIRADWVRIEPHLGRQRAFWTWLFGQWERLRVEDGGEVVLVDLMAGPTRTIDEPVDRQLGDVRVQVDSPREILVNKLCALLGRLELRDVADVRELVAHGGDLEQALSLAPEKDGGFSPLTLAWALRGMAVIRLALASGWSAEEAKALDRFRAELVDRLVQASAPDA